MSIHAHEAIIPELPSLQLVRRMSALPKQTTQAGMEGLVQVLCLHGQIAGSKGLRL